MRGSKTSETTYAWTAFLASYLLIALVTFLPPAHQSAVITARAGLEIFSDGSH